MNFLFGGLFWVIEIVQLCPATDRIASCLSNAAQVAVVDIFLALLRCGSLTFPRDLKLIFGNTYMLLIC